MPTLPKLKQTKAGKAKTKARGNAIDSAQRALLERQNEIQAQIDALQRSLAEKSGPAQGSRFVHGVSVVDARRITSVAAPTRRPAPKRPTMLRAERIAARRQTMALVVFLAVALMYALSHLLPG